MTKKPEPKQGDSGRYVRNGSRAKSGLSTAILSSGWGLFVILLSYKARKAGKLVIRVPPHHSSQECARCGHVHPDNRPSRAAFVCQRCGHVDNADQNASRVIARRGIRLLPDEKIRKTEVRRCGIGKPKQPGQKSCVKASGQENPTPRPQTPSRILGERGTFARERETPPAAQSTWGRESSCENPAGRR
ncbi:MAG: transposase [Nitrospirae bacterium]|nr:transposase [Nitrospirota bacterium]